MNVESRVYKEPVEPGQVVLVVANIDLGWYIPDGDPTEALVMMRTWATPVAQLEDGRRVPVGDGTPALFDLVVGPADTAVLVAGMLASIAAAPPS